MKHGEVFHIKEIGEGKVQVEVRSSKKEDGQIARSVKIKMTSDALGNWMVEQLKDFGLEETRKNDKFLGLVGKDLVAGFGSNILIIRCDFTPTPSSDE